MVTFGDLLELTVRLPKPPGDRLRLTCVTIKKLNGNVAERWEAARLFDPRQVLRRQVFRKM